MNNELNIKVLKHQKAFILSKAVHTGLVAGFGAGKTEAAIKKTIIKKLRYPQYPVAYYLPTYPLIKDIAYPKFSSILNEFNIKFELNKTDHEFNTIYGKIILRSMDKPESIIGYEVAYSLIDETDVVPIDKMRLVYSYIIARNRCKLPDNERNQTDIVGTPEGFKWLYKFFVKEAKRSKLLIKAKTTDNPYLPDGYIETLIDNYTSEQILAYIDGEFVNLNSGTVYKQYDRKLNHSNETFLKGEVLMVGQDFNITNMNSVIHVVREGKPIAIGEISGAYDTFEVTRILKERYPTNKIAIFPDASGKNRSTSGVSDLEIFKQAGFVVNGRSSNPFVRDRVNAMNLNFCDNSGVRNYLVNTDQCPVYTEALEQLGYKNGEPDKTSGFDHITEAAGYFIYDRFGIRKQRRGQR